MLLECGNAFFNVLAVLALQVRICSGFTVTVVEKPGNSIGSVIWESAFRLCRYLVQSQSSMSLAGKRVLELGSGTGICGVAAACLGARVRLTDRTEALELLQANIAANADQIVAAAGKCSAHELDWCSESTMTPLRAEYDVLLASDVVYKADLVTPLLRTLEFFCPPGSRCVLLLAYKKRFAEEEAPFFDGLKQRGFTISVLEVEDAEDGEEKGGATRSEEHLAGGSTGGSKEAEKRSSVLYHISRIITADC